jgi:hypothetical protein
MVHVWKWQIESTQKGILVGVMAAEGTFLQGMRGLGAAVM